MNEMMMGYFWWMMEHAWWMVGAVGVGLAGCALWEWAADLGRVGPMGWPVLGNLSGLLRQYHRMYDYTVELERRYPGYFYLRLNRDRVHFLFEPRDIEHMLKTNFANYTLAPHRNVVFDDFLGSGIFNADGALWHAQRKTSASMFAVRKFRFFVNEVFSRHGAVASELLAGHCATG